MTTEEDVQALIRLMGPTWYIWVPFYHGTELEALVAFLMPAWDPERVSRVAAELALTLDGTQ